MGKVGNDGQALAALGSWTTAYAQSVSQRQATQGPFQNGSQFGTQENDFGSRLDYANSQNQGSTAGTITTRGGETLEGIAASLWGDAGLWYKLAQANGLSGDTTLAAGQTLRIPAGVMRNTFNAATVTPTDPNDTIGDVNPTTPQAAPPKRRRCGGLGTILLMVVAAVVAWKLAPLIIGKAATAGVAATATTSAVVAKGATGLTAVMGAGAAKVVGTGLAMAAGSIVSQVVGVATGIQEKFSWKQVAMAFIGGAVGAGMGNAFGGIQNAALRAAVSGAASSAVTQGVSVALGLQDRFSWAAVAAAGISGAVSTAIGDRLGVMEFTDNRSPTNVLKSLAADGVGSIAGAAVRSLVDGSDFGDNLRSSLPTVLGDAISSYLTAELSASQRHAPVSQAAIDRAEAASASAGRPPLTEAQKVEIRLNVSESLLVVERSGGSHDSYLGLRDTMIDSVGINATQEERDAARRVFSDGVDLEASPTPGGPVAQAAPSSIAAAAVCATPAGLAATEQVSDLAIVVWGSLPTPRFEAALGFELVDSLAIDSAVLAARVGAAIDSVPGASLALQALDLAMMASGGFVRAGLQFAANLVGQEISQGIQGLITDRFRAVGYSMNHAALGGAGSTILSSAATTGLHGAVAGATGAISAARARLAANRARGMQFEADVINGVFSHVGIAKNTLSRVGFNGTRDVIVIPDVTGRPAGQVEIKDVRVITSSSQLRASADVARREGMPYSLIVSPRTRYISPRAQALFGDRIYVYDPATDTLRRW